MTWLCDLDFIDMAYKSIQAISMKVIIQLIATTPSASDFAQDLWLVNTTTSPPKTYKSTRTRTRIFQSTNNFTAKDLLSAQTVMNHRLHEMAIVLDGDLVLCWREILHKDVTSYCVGRRHLVLGWKTSPCTMLMGNLILYRRYRFAWCWKMSASYYARKCWSCIE